MKPHACDHADDFAHHPAFFVVAGINSESFADRIFTGKILFSHCLIDNDDARRVFGVALGKCATTQQRRLERRKIIAADHFEIAVQHVRRLRSGVLLAPKTSLPPAHERSVRADGSVLHTGQRADFVEQCPGKRVDLFAIVIFSPRQFEARGEECARLVAQRKRLEARKTFQNQAGCDQQSERERNFADHHPSSRAHGRWRIAAPSGAGFQRELNVGVRGLPCRPQTEKHSRKGCDEEGETENPEIEGNLLKSRNVSGTQRDQAVPDPDRQKETEHSAKERDQKTFDE